MGITCVSAAHEVGLYSQKKIKMYSTKLMIVLGLLAVLACMINADPEPGYGYRRHGYSRYHGYPATRHHYGKYRNYGKYRYPYGYYKKHHLVHPVPHPEPVPAPAPEPVPVPAPEPVPVPAPEPVPVPVSVPAITHTFEEQVGTIVRELPATQQFVIAEPEPAAVVEPDFVDPRIAVPQPAVVQQVVSQETVPIGNVVVSEQTQIVDPALLTQPQAVFNAVGPEVSEVQFVVPPSLAAFPAVPNLPVA